MPFCLSPEQVNTSQPSSIHLKDSPERAHRPLNKKRTSQFISFLSSQSDLLPQPSICSTHSQHVLPPTHSSHRSITPLASFCPYLWAKINTQNAKSTLNTNSKARKPHTLSHSSLRQLCLLSSPLIRNAQMLCPLNRHCSSGHCLTSSPLSISAAPRDVSYLLAANANGMKEYVACRRSFCVYCNGSHMKSEVERRKVRLVGTAVWK